MTAVHIPNARFGPRVYQRPLLLHYTGNGHDGRKKRGACVWHRRSGKDITAMVIIDICAWRRVGMYWHTFPTFEQGRKAIWEGFTKDGERIIDFIFPAEQIRSRDNQQMRIELKNGSIYRIVGTDKIESVGAGPVGVVHSEYSIAKPKARDLIAPMLRENEGWDLCVYTPRGNNHGKKLFDRARELAKAEPERWFCDLKTLYDTRAYDPEQTLSEERAEGKPEAYVRQEYLCDWTAANVGSVWGEQMEALEKAGRLEAFEHPEDGVFTTWDLGHRDATAIWFWRINDKRLPDLIDHYEMTGKPLSHFFDVLDAKPYEYVKHWVPHDSRAHTYTTGVSGMELFVDHFGKDRVAVVPNLSLEDGIQAARWILQQPLRFHPRCGDGVEALKSYHYAWDEDAKVFSNAPEHDWSSHTADAFRYVACVVKRTEQITRPVVQQHSPIAVPLSGSFTLEQLFEDRERERRDG